MVFLETMQERIDSNRQCKKDHYEFEPVIVDDIDSQDGQTGHDKREQCTMNGTGDGCSDPQGVIIDLEHGQATKLMILQQSCIPPFHQNPCLRRNFVSIH